MRRTTLLLLVTLAGGWGCGDEITGNPDLCREFPSGGLGGPWAGTAADVRLALDLEGRAPGERFVPDASGTAVLSRAGSADTLAAVVSFDCLHHEGVSMVLHRVDPPATAEFEGRRIAVEGLQATRLEGTLTGEVWDLAGEPLVLTRPGA